MPEKRFLQKGIAFFRDKSILLYMTAKSVNFSEIIFDKMRVM